MRAAVLTESHNFEVVDVPDPAPGEGELLVRVRACGICGSDLKSYTMLPPGAVLGHEFCGEVVAVGPDVDGNWPLGETVAAMPLRACGRCRWCIGDEPAHCERVDALGLGGSPGAFAELVRVDARLAVPLVNALGSHGALVESLAVGLHTVAAAELHPGDRVLVLGGGSIGVAVAMWARRFAAGDIVVSEPSPDRRESAATFGASDTHDPAKGPPPTGFDVVIECVGAPGMVQAAVDAAATRGRVVVAGVCMVPDQIVPLGAVMKEIQVRFAVYYRRSEFQAAARLLNSGDLNPEPFVTGVVTLDGVGEAFRRLESGTTDRKVLVRPGG